MSGKGATGRGGRGAAILEALKAKSVPVRRPGDESQLSSTQPLQQEKEEVVTVASAGGVQAPASRPMVGRGALLARIAQAGAKSPVEPGAASASNLVTQPSGALPGGRGMAMLRGISKTSPPSSVPSPSPLPSPAPSVSSEPPTKELEALSVDPPEEKKPAEFRGELGTLIPVVANHIPVQIKEGCGVFEYAVMFSPNIDSRNIRFKLIASQSDFLGKTRTFDGSKLFLPMKLSEPVCFLNASHPVDGTSVQITVKFICQRSLGDCVQLFNILFRRVMYAMKLVQIGRHTFDQKASIPIPKHKLEMWPGFITAIQEYEGGLMLCAETSHRVLRTQTVLEILYDIQRANPGTYRDELFKKVVGSIVLTRYNNKTYRVDDVIWEDSPRSTFQTSAGAEISYVDYYWKSYQIQLQDLDQPLLLHRVKKKALGEEGQTKILCMMPELCYLTGLTDEMRSDFYIMKDISTHTRLGPSARQAELTKFINNVNDCPKAKELLSDWGVFIQPKLASLNGRVLKEERIFFRSGQCGAGKEADWGREMTRNQVLKAVEFCRWCILFTKRDQMNTRSFIDMVRKVGPQLGINVQAPRSVELRDDRNDTLMRSLRENISGDCQLVVVISPTPRDDRYSLIKKICCCECPIPSQVINGRTISKQQTLRSVTQKVLLQINCKLGGELWSLEIPLKNLMVCGIDAYHDPSRKNTSVLGLVASLNQTLTRWFCSSSFQVAGQEMGGAINVCLVQSLQKYYDVNHNLPEKVIIFRDGVSDGQLEHVSRYEIPQIMAAFNVYGAEYKPAMTFIVVQKRINTRIFADLNGSRGGESLGNPPPGSVVDHTLTKKYWYDFFLVSQHVRQGTVTPTHYIVVHNTTGLKPDHIQRITYKMTHLYYNWPGTIRVPAPCQYAHKLAYLIGQNIHKEPSADLKDRLFFL